MSQIRILSPTHLQTRLPRMAHSHMGGGWNAIRYQILDPLINQIPDPPNKSNIRYHTPYKIKYQISDPQRNQISDITPPKKSNIRYQGTPVPPPTPTPPPTCARMLNVASPPPPRKLNWAWLFIAAMLHFFLFHVWLYMHHIPLCSYHYLLSISPCFIFMFANKIWISYWIMDIWHGVFIKLIYYIIC